MLQAIGSLGGCLAYDLVALAVGQKGGWRTLLSLYAVGAADIVTAKKHSSVGKPLERTGSCYDVSNQCQSFHSPPYGYSPRRGCTVSEGTFGD